LITFLTSTTIAQAWTRISETEVVLTNEEVEDLLKEKLANEQLNKAIELYKQGQSLTDKQIDLLKQEIDLEKKRADFEHDQFTSERETRKFESEQYNKLLEASKPKPITIERVLLVILSAGMILLIK
jgi:hypothetical protein